MVFIFTQLHCEMKNHEGHEGVSSVNFVVVLKMIITYNLPFVFKYQKWRFLTNKITKSRGKLPAALRKSKIYKGLSGDVGNFRNASRRARLVSRRPDRPYHA